MSSFGRAVLATRPDSAGPEAGPFITVSSAVGGTSCLTVTEGPVAGPLGELARLQPASRVAAAATPIRPARWMSLLIVCSLFLVPPATAAGPPMSGRKSAARAEPDNNVSVSWRESSPLL